VLLIAGNLLADLGRGHLLPPAILAALLALGWFSVALRVTLRSRSLPWARRAAPLFLGMGLAEMLRGIDHDRLETWSLSGVLLCASMAALAARSALIDLDGAVRAEQHQLDEISVALSRASSEADQLSVWREQLTHDARNAFAGVRAAMEILERYDGRVDPNTTEGLRQAAAREIGHLEHLVTRGADQDGERFCVSDVVRSVGECARALGNDVAVRGHQTYGVGRPGDLDAVLRNLLVNAQVHAPGSTVEIRVSNCKGMATVVVADDGPGLGPVGAAQVFERGYRGPASPGSGLGLWGARELMREQGGDLSVIDGGTGATFLVTLPAAPVPTQRGNVAVLTARTNRPQAIGQPTAQHIA
jgi:signal transduction histidine kinase